MPFGELRHLWGMSMDVLIRPACPADMAALDHLVQRSYAQLLAFDYPPSVLVTALGPLGSVWRVPPRAIDGGMVFVAEGEGRLLGVAGWSLGAPGGQPGQRGIGHLVHLATDPDRVRRGIGRAVLERVCLVAKASGMAGLVCDSTLTAVPFLVAMGFVEEGPLERPLPGGLVFESLRMRRML